MLYRIGSTGLGADALEKMRIAGLLVMRQHVPWFPDGMEATLGLDRCYNHEQPERGNIRSVGLPVFLVARLQITVGITTYEANDQYGNYWASAIVQHSCEPFPADHRPMLASEGLCALSQFPTLKEIVCGAGWPHGGYCQVYIDADGKTIKVRGWDCRRPHAYVGYVPSNICGSSMPLKILT